MIQKMAWNTFENTGNIMTYLEFNQLKNIKENMGNINNGTIENKGNNYIRK